MKRHFFKVLSLLLFCATVLQLNAQIAFSMDDEKANQNTPEGWKPVELPQGLPEFTAENTFDITAAPFNASTSSEDNTAAIQAALDAAANAGGGMVVIPAGTFLSNCLQMGSKTVLHLTGKKDASDIVIEGESRTTSVIDGQGGPWWDQVEAAKAVKKSTKRHAMIRFWQGSRYLFRNFCVQNAPNTNITIGRSGKGGHATAHSINIKISILAMIM